MISKFIDLVYIRIPKKYKQFKQKPLLLRGFCCKIFIDFMTVS